MPSYRQKRWTPRAGADFGGPHLKDQCGNRCGYPPSGRRIQRSASASGDCLHREAPAAIVAKELRSSGFAFTDGIGQTGVSAFSRTVSDRRYGFVPIWTRTRSIHITGLPYAATTKQRLDDGSEIDVMHALARTKNSHWTFPKGGVNEDETNAAPRQGKRARKVV